VSADRRNKEHKTGFDRTSLNVPDGVSFFAPKKGGKALKLEVIPYKSTGGNPHADEGDWAFERTFFVHRNVGPDDKASYVCLSKTFGEKCPVCEHRSKMATNPKADEDLVKDLAQKERQLFLVFDHEEQEKGVQLWDISYHLFGKFLDQKLKSADEEDQEAWNQFADHESGMTLRVTPAEKKLPGGTILEFADIEFRERRIEIPKAVFKHGIDVDAIPKKLEYGELKKILLQVDDDADDDDEPKKKRAVADDDDLPPKKKGGKPQAADDDDDEPEKEGEKAAFKKGDTVSFIYKGKRKIGTVDKINAEKKILSVDVEGQDAPSVVDFADAVVQPPDDDDDDDKPKKGGGKKAASKDDDDLFGDDDDHEPKKDKADDDEDPPAKKKTAAKDDDDDLFGDDDDDEPKPKKKGK
jgi:hypothetical protein